MSKAANKATEKGKLSPHSVEHLVLTLYSIRNMAQMVKQGPDPSTKVGFTALKPEGIIAMIDEALDTYNLLLKEEKPKKRVIYDERAGMVAVYFAPEMTCLARDDSNFIYVKHFNNNGTPGGWIRDDEACNMARHIADRLNERFDQQAGKQVSNYVMG